jgi:putative tricarboxylic transport membrane protein
MTLRADHVAGAAFVLFGVAVFTLSGDLPTGQLSMPGSGFMPKIIAAVLVLFGAVLVLRARESQPFAALDWSDLRHAGPVVALTALATALYTVAGFALSVAALLFLLLVLVERKPLLPAALYSVAVTVLAHELFARVLKSPLPTGPFGY